MTPFNIAFLFCRLLSIWCVARFVEAFGQVAAQMFIFSMGFSRSRTAISSQLFYVTWPLGLILMSCVLWIGAPTIARSVAQDIEYSMESGNSAILQNWWNIGRGLLGLYFVIRAASVFVGTLLSLFSSGNNAPFQTQNFGSLASAVVEVVLGAALLLVARRAMKREAVQYNSTSSPNES